MKILLIALSVASASLSKLHRLIESARGNRFVKINGREVPRALFDAIEAHGKILEISERIADDGGIRAMVAVSNALPEDRNLRQADRRLLRDNAAKSALAQKQVDKAVIHALQVHARLAKLFKFPFDFDKHLTSLEQRRLAVKVNLEAMFADYSFERTQAYGESMSMARLGIFRDICEDLAAVRMAYADWVFPKIRFWSGKRKMRAALGAFDYSMMRVEESDDDEVSLGDALIDLGVNHLAKVKGELEYTGDVRDKAMTIFAKQQISQWFWRVNGAELRIFLQSLTTGLTRNSNRSKLWKAVIDADDAVNAAERNKKTHGPKDMSLSASIERSEIFAEAVKRGGRLSNAVILKRKAYRVRIRKFLESY